MAEIFHNKLKILICRLQHRKPPTAIMASKVKLFDNSVEICTCEIAEKTAHSAGIWKRKYANNVALNELYYVPFITEFSHFPSNSCVAKLCSLLHVCFASAKRVYTRKKLAHIL